MTIDEYNSAVNDYSDRVYRFVLKNIKDVHKAEDIVQDSYEKLWKNHANVDFNKVRAYLFSTAYHTLIDVVRKEKWTSASDDLTQNESFHNDQYSDVKEILDEAVKKLPEIQRMVLLLRDYEGYSYKEIGNITTLSESQVKVYIYRARVYLKNYIKKIDILV